MISSISELARLCGGIKENWLIACGLDLVWRNPGRNEHLKTFCRPMFIPWTQYSISVGVERQWFGGSEKQAFIFTIINDSSGSPPQCGFHARPPFTWTTFNFSFFICALIQIYVFPPQYLRSCRNCKLSIRIENGPVVYLIVHFHNWAVWSEGGIVRKTPQLFLNKTNCFSRKHHKSNLQIGPRFQPWSFITTFQDLAITGI